MNINIKSLSGRIINVHVEPTCTITQVKEKVQEMEGIGPDQQRLIFNGVLLKNELKISETRLKPGSTLHMVLALRGGTRSISNVTNYSSDSSLNTIINIPPIILPNDSSNLIDTTNSDSYTDTLYEISFQDHMTTKSNSSSYISIDRSRKLCCLIL
jgi:hypothetical protein